MPFKFNTPLYTQVAPWWRTRLRSIQNPFKALEPYPQHYCPICKDLVDIEIESGRAGGIKAYRKNCLRCGRVLQHGIDKIHLTKGKSLPQKALDFIRLRKNDRR